jgi:Uma2 family endonuclease
MNTKLYFENGKIIVVITEDGAPGIVVEILSPSTAWMDESIKFEKYRTSGVKEYWLVDPNTKTIRITNFVNSTFAVFTEGEIAKSKILEGLQFDTSPIFASL